MGVDYGKERIRKAYQRSKERTGLNCWPALGNVQYQRYLSPADWGRRENAHLPVFIDICKALKISPDYLLQDELEENEISTIWEIEALWKDTSPSKQALALAMIKAVLEHKE